LRNKVACLRKDMGITQSEFAKMVGISRTALSAIENGTLPKAQTMQKIAKLLNMSIEDIFFKDDVV